MFDDTTTGGIASCNSIAPSANAAERCLTTQRQAAHRLAAAPRGSRRVNWKPAALRLPEELYMIPVGLFALP
ncbi:hypothetical protein LSAT2_030266 [Lamellibrachia satsuma]|nr:hypothetical protein LSAT2_030266 [Lamellibrachia satsuma]